VKYKVYKITCTKSEKVYIGRTKIKLQRRLNQHFSKARNGSNFKFHKAIRKYGEQSFEIILIEEFDNSEDCALAEMRIIAELKTYSNGYNSSKGGKGEYRTEESYQAQSRKMKGRKFSDSHRKNLSKSIKEGYDSGRIKQSTKGKKMTNKQKKNMTGNKKAGKFNKTLKGSKVIELTNQICFYSLRDAGKFFNINGTSIARSITNNRTCKKLKFAYI
jgi:group I intron endonuclease